MTLPRSLQINEPSIDAQHERLLELLQQSARFSGSRLNSEPVVDHLSQLTQLICLHFDFEEAVMREVGVPQAELERHIAEHGRIVAELSAIHLETMGGSHRVLGDISEQVRDWVGQHMKSFDLSLRPYFTD